LCNMFGVTFQHQPMWSIVINPLVPEFSKTSEIVKTYINIHTTYGIQ